jgi:secreted trypsin-like serine protease
MKGLFIVLTIFFAAASANFAAQYYRSDLFVNSKFAQIAIDPLIIGGTDADIADFPFQLSLRVNGNHRCGASVISTEWILSAAHCLGKF